MATYQLPDGRTVSDSMAFVLDEIQYPDNWLRLSTVEERKSRDISGPLPEPAWYDEQFYWGFDDNGSLIPKEHTQLVAQYSEYVRMNANAMLRDTDWMVIREADNGTATPTGIKAWRQSIREAAGTKVAAIEATTNTDELASYITGPDYPVWPSDPSVTAEPASSAGMGFTGNVVSSGF